MSSLWSTSNMVSNTSSPVSSLCWFCCQGSSVVSLNSNVHVFNPNMIRLALIEPYILPEFLYMHLFLSLPSLSVCVSCIGTSSRVLKFASLSACLKIRDKCHVPSSVIFSRISWSRVFHWTWSLAFQLGNAWHFVGAWLVPPEFASLHASPQCFD